MNYSESIYRGLTFLVIACPCAVAISVPLAYFTGIADAGWTAIGLAIGTYLNWLFVAKRLRIYSEKIDAITVPAFFSKRFKDEKKILLGIAAIIIVAGVFMETSSAIIILTPVFLNLSSSVSKISLCNLSSGITCESLPPILSSASNISTL